MTDKNYAPLDLKGTMAANIVHFARALRAAGMRVGPGAALEAVRAILEVGPRRRADFYWALHCVFVERHDQHQIFDQAFALFWRSPKVLERLMADLYTPSIPPARGDGEEAPPVAQRVLDALSLEADQPPGQEDEEPPAPEPDSTMTFSAQQIARTMDFEGMTGEELAHAKAAIAKLRLPIEQVPTRRFQPDARGNRIDMRASLRASMKPGGEVAPLKRRHRAQRPPPVVVLCDVSGSMSRYSRMFLHFVHAITNDRDRVHTFIFGTRLTNITRLLQHRDVDVALDKTASTVDDWSGGTRIGECLRTFNYTWSRRVLGQGAMVLLITDGLDRDDLGVLEREIDRLHRSCRRLIWLNPLLRYEGFRPEAGGIKTILPCVDEFRPVHNLQSLMDISEALSQRRVDNLDAA